MTSEDVPSADDEQLAVQPELKSTTREPLGAADAEDAPAARGLAGPSLYNGRKAMFSYGTSAMPGVSYNPSGALAVAAILDIWNVSPFNFPRTVYGKGGANDGNPHYPPEYAVEVAKRFPPTGLWGTPIANKEDLVQAFAQCGLYAPIGHSGAFGDGKAEEKILRDWLRVREWPVICLLDNGHISGARPGLNWALVFGWNDVGVWVAADGGVSTILWPQFRAAWHCAGLPYPNNFLGVYPH